MFGIKAITVDSIMATFNKTINDLTTLAETKNQEKNDIDAQIIQLDEARKEAVQESQKATKVANNLKKLLEG